MPAARPLCRWAARSTSHCLHFLPSLSAAYGRVYKGRWNGAIVAVKVGVLACKLFS